MGAPDNREEGVDEREYEEKHCQGLLSQGEKVSAVAFHHSNLIKKRASAKLGFEGKITISHRGVHRASKAIVEDQIVGTD